MTSQLARNSIIPPDQPDRSPLVTGTALAVGAYMMWGMFPLYFKLLAHVSPLEVLAQRTAWTLLFVTLMMVFMGRREIFQRPFYTPKVLGIMALSALALAVNWGVFIVAVSSAQVLQSSLGYFMSPLMSVLFAIIVLAERPRPLAWVAIGLAFVGVANLVWTFGEVPWIALGLGISWGLYGLLRKLAPLGSLAGLYVETLLLTPLALIYLGYLYYAGSLAFAAGGGDMALLVGVGAVTATPLLLFARATRILALTTIGVLQYIVPTGQFLLAVFVFDEPFGDAQMLTFALIWTALALYVGDSLHARHRSRRGVKPSH